MKILDDIIANLDLEAEVQDIRVGIFHTGVMSRNCGLASSLTSDALKEHEHGSPLVNDPGNLLGKKAADLVKLAYSQSLLEAAIGMATINSLLPIDESNCLHLNAANLIAEKGEGKKIAIIGHFPFIPKLQNIAKELWVMEKNPREGDLSESQSKNYLPQADVIGITGTAITNHTIETLLPMCNPKAYLVVLGDTAPLSPVLFDYGIDAISGTKVIDPQTALQGVSEGATFRQIQGIAKLIMLKEAVQR